MNKNKKYCKILKNNKIMFFHESINKYEVFGWIDDLGIMFNIEKEYFNFTLTEKIPNPPLEFYIELGELLKERIEK